MKVRVFFFGENAANLIKFGFLFQSVFVVEHWLTDCPLVITIEVYYQEEKQ